MSVPVNEGSSLYYALWGLEDGSRERALARLALGDAMNDALLDVREPDVARRKVHWWHEELERLHAGSPRHPAAVACRELAGSDAAMARALDALGAAAEDRLDPATAETDLDRRLARGAGARLWLVLDGLDPAILAGAAELPEIWQPLAIGLARHERLARLAALLSREHPVFATETWQAASARPADIAANDAKAAARGDAVVRRGVALARERLADGIAQVAQAVPRGAAARAPLTLARLRDAQLALWQRKVSGVVRERPSLTPIRKFFIAWRTR